MAALALITVGLSMLIPVIGWFVVGPLTALIIGAGAGWWASKVLGYGTAGRGAGAGALAGLGALFGAAIGLAVLGALFGNNPEVQQGLQQALTQAQEQNPQATLPAGITGGAVLGSAGGVIGGCLGLIDLALSTIGGLIAGLVYGRNRGTAAVPAMTYSAPISSPPPMTGSITTPLSEPEHGARIYDETPPASETPDEERRE